MHKDTITPPTMNCETTQATITERLAAIHERIKKQKSEIPNNDTVCNGIAESGVTEFGTSSESSPSSSVYGLHQVHPVQAANPNSGMAELEASSQKLEALQTQTENQKSEIINSEIPNNDALRNGVIEFFANRIAALQNHKGEAKELR